VPLTESAIYISGIADGAVALTRSPSRPERLLSRKQDPSRDDLLLEPIYKETSVEAKKAEKKKKNKQPSSAMLSAMPGYAAEYTRNKKEARTALRRSPP